MSELPITAGGFKHANQTFLYGLTTDRFCLYRMGDAAPITCMPVNLHNLVRTNSQDGNSPFHDVQGSFRPYVAVHRYNSGQPDEFGSRAGVYFLAGLSGSGSVVRVRIGYVVLDGNGNVVARGYASRDVNKTGNSRYAMNPNTTYVIQVSAVNFTTVSWVPQVRFVFVSGVDTTSGLLFFAPFLVSNLVVKNSGICTDQEASYGEICSGRNTRSLVLKSLYNSSEQENKRVGAFSLFGTFSYVYYMRFAVEVFTNFSQDREGSVRGASYMYYRVDIRDVFLGNTDDALYLDNMFTTFFSSGALQGHRLNNVNPMYFGGYVVAQLDNYSSAAHGDPMGTTDTVYYKYVDWPQWYTGYERFVFRQPSSDIIYARTSPSTSSNVEIEPPIVHGSNVYGYVPFVVRRVRNLPGFSVIVSDYRTEFGNEYTGFVVSSDRPLIPIYPGKLLVFADTSQFDVSEASYKMVTSSDSSFDVYRAAEYRESVQQSYWLDTFLLATQVTREPAQDVNEGSYSFYEARPRPKLSIKITGIEVSK